MTMQQLGDTLADFHFTRQFERQGLPVGKMTIFDVEWIVAGSVPSMQTFDMTFFSETSVSGVDIKMANFGLAYLTCHWLPLFESDAFTFPNNWTALETLMNQRIGKVEEAHPMQPRGLPYDMDPQDEQGADVSLIYRPDRISLRALEASQVVMPYTQLYRRLLRFGGFTGGYYRTGEDAKIAYMRRVRGAIQRIFSTNLPGAIVWAITIPPAVDAQYKIDKPNGNNLRITQNEAKDPQVTAPANATDAYGGYDASKLDGLGGAQSYTEALNLDNWTEYEFLAPKVNPISGEKVYPTGMAMINNFRRLANQFYGFVRTRKDGTPDIEDTPYYLQAPLNVQWARDISFARSYSAPSRIGPAG